MLNHQNTKNLKRQLNMENRLNQKKSAVMGDDPFVVHSYNVNVNNHKKTSNQRSKVFNGTSNNKNNNLNSTNKTVTLSDNINLNYNNFSLAKSDKLVLISSETADDKISGGNKHNNYKNNLRHNKSKKLFNKTHNQALRHNKFSQNHDNQDDSSIGLTHNNSSRKNNYSNSVLSVDSTRSNFENKFRKGYYSENLYPGEKYSPSRYTSNEVSLVSNN